MVNGAGSGTRYWLYSKKSGKKVSKDILYVQLCWSLNVAKLDNGIGIF